MHVFKAGRLHFLEAAIRAAISSAPLVLLGAPPEVFFWLAALANAFGGQNHWNVDARLPRWLDLLIATPGAHWLHHRKEMGDGSANLSTYTLLFDHLFGTYRRPAGRADYDVGIADDPISSNIFAQLAAPAAFLPSIRRWRRARDIRSG
jgi:sterol desaturase/sphingolipid hydroxylase (fatty acid hydroxylase superfamily)